jgi:hypothetical protein
MYFRAGVHRLGQDKFGDVPFGPAGHRAGQMQPSAGGRATGQYEGIEGRQPGIEGVDFTLQALDLSLDDAERRWAGRRWFGCAQVGAQIEQVILDARQHGVDLGPVTGIKADQSQHGIGLINGAVSRHPDVVLRHPAAVAEGGFTAVAAAGVNAGQSHHGPNFTKFGSFWRAQKNSGEPKRKIHPPVRTGGCSWGKGIGWR